MFGRPLLAPSLALSLALLASRPAGAAAHTPVAETPAPETPTADAPTDDRAPPAETPAPETPADPPTTDRAPPAETPTAPETTTPTEPPPAEPPPATAPETTTPTDPPPREIDRPTDASADPFADTDTPPPATPPSARPVDVASPRAPAIPPPTTTPVSSGVAPASPSPPPASAPAPAPAPGRKETLGEANKRRTEADRKQRFRHGGFIIDAQVGGAGCLRAVCQGATGHRAAPGLHLGGFVGFNLFGLLEFGIEGGWNNLRPRGVAGRNAMALYGLDPGQLQQALQDNIDLPLPPVDFGSLEVSSANSRAFDVGPAVRLHLLRKGRGLLFVGAGVHYQLWRNRYATPGGSLRLDTHGASIPLRVGGGVFIHRNLALMAEVAYAPAVFGAMGVHLPDTTGVVPFKLYEDITGVKVTRGLPHFWTVAFTLRFRLGA